MQNSVKIKCPAKINLTLEIVNRRDDGFHNIKSIMQNDSGVEIIKISDSEVKNIKFQIENDSVKSYVMQNGIWVESSTLKSKSGDITIYNKDGSELKFFDIKNNIDFPEDLYFEPPEEVDDEVVFGL